MSHYRVSIDQCIRLYVSQGLTEAETALCLSVRRNIQISTRHLRRRRAGWSFTDSCTSVMLLAVNLTGQISVITNHTLNFDHVMKARLINYPVIRGNKLRCLVITHWFIPLSWENKPLSRNNEMIFLWSRDNRMKKTVVATVALGFCSYCMCDRISLLICLLCLLQGLSRKNSAAPFMTAYTLKALNCLFPDNI